MGSCTLRENWKIIVQKGDQKPAKKRLHFRRTNLILVALIVHDGVCWIFPGLTLISCQPTRLSSDNRKRFQTCTHTLRHVCTTAHYYHVLHRVIKSCNNVRYHLLISDALYVRREASIIDRHTNHRVPIAARSPLTTVPVSKIL